MTINELRIKLRNLGIEDHEFNLGDKPICELQIGLLKGKNTWKVYQSAERGKINIIATFNDENNACKLLLKYLEMRKKRKDRKK